MEFLDNFGKKVQDVAFIAAEKAQQVAAVASEKASIVADKAKTEYEMAAERRSMDKNYRAIGEWYVSALEGDAPEAVADIVAAIKDSQDKLAAYEAAKAEAAAAKAEAARCQESKRACHRGDHREENRCGRACRGRKRLRSLRGSACTGGTCCGRGTQGKLNPETKGGAALAAPPFLFERSVWSA